MLIRNRKIPNARSDFSGKNRLMQSIQMFFFWGLALIISTGTQRTCWAGCVFVVCKPGIVICVIWKTFVCILSLSDDTQSKFFIFRHSANCKIQKHSAIIISYQNNVIKQFKTLTICYKVLCLFLRNTLDLTFIPVDPEGICARSYTKLDLADWT